MIVIPAIDIQNGKVVRLVQGKFDDVKEYFPNPVVVADFFAEEGAELLHIIDLDGAKEGHIVNSDTIIQIAKHSNIPVQTGGGIRTEEDIEKLLSGGVNRVILGTKAVEDQEFLRNVLERWGDKIVISLDCANGMVAQHGWTSVSELKAIDFAKELQDLGVKCIVYTDIAKDGMMRGPNFSGIKEMLEAVDMSVIASGGISKIEDIEKLLEFGADNLFGTITGKAIYENKLDLKEAIALCAKG